MVLYTYSRALFFLVLLRLSYTFVVGYPVVKLSDMGLARVGDANKQYVKVTNQGLLPGMYILHITRKRKLLRTCSRGLLAGNQG